MDGGMGKWHTFLTGLGFPPEGRPVGHSVPHPGTAALKVTSSGRDLHTPALPSGGALAGPRWPSSEHRPALGTNPISGDRPRPNPPPPGPGHPCSVSPAAGKPTGGLIWAAACQCPQTHHPRQTGLPWTPDGRLPVLTKGTESRALDPTPPRSADTQPHPLVPQRPPWKVPSRMPLDPERPAHSSFSLHLSEAAGGRQRPLRRAT